jgi:hypothetical protein
MHCTMSISAHVCAYAIDHVEPESEMEKELVQGALGGPQASNCVDTNLSLTQRKPRCIPPTIFDFSLITIFMLCLIVH